MCVSSLWPCRVNKDEILVILFMFVSGSQTGFFISGAEAGLMLGKNTKFTPLTYSSTWKLQNMRVATIKILWYQGLSAATVTHLW